MTRYSNMVRISRMTTHEVGQRMQAGTKRVILSSGSIEQHGKHLPMHTDYVLAEALAVRAAHRMGHTLVAPVVPIGCAEHHMSFPGTVSVQRDVFIHYMENAAESLIRHGFEQILMTSFHGGNFAPSLEAVARLRERHPQVDFRTALDLQELLNTTNGVIHQFFPDRTAKDCHAGCVETSMMFFLDRDYVRTDQVVNGAQLTELPPLDDLRDVTPTGVLGIVDGYSVEIGERLFDALVAFLLRSWGFEAVVR